LSKTLPVLATVMLSACGMLRQAPTRTPTPETCRSADVATAFVEATSIDEEFTSIWGRAWELALTRSAPETVRRSLADLDRLQDKLWGVYYYVAPPCIQHIVACDLEVMDWDMLALDSLLKGCVECARDAGSRASARDEECTNALIDFQISREQRP